MQIGVDTGLQMFADMLTIVLNRIHGYGKARIQALLAEVKKLLESELTDAFQTQTESDYQRDVLDRVLRDIMQEQFVPFEKRYPYVKGIRYGGR